MAYRSGIVIIDGKRIDLDDCKEVYGDGRFRGSRGISVNITKGGNVLIERWTNWQGEGDQYEVVPAQDAIELLQSLPHPERAGRGIEMLSKHYGIVLPEG